MKKETIFFSHSSRDKEALNYLKTIIGFGIDICELRPPLNLLQGFNLTSHEGLNNIIKTINDECETENRRNIEYFFVQ